MIFVIPEGGAVCVPDKQKGPRPFVREGAFYGRFESQICR